MILTFCSWKLSSMVILANILKNRFIFKNYLEEYKEYKRYDENDILLILKGIKDILFYFLYIVLYYH